MEFKRSQKSEVPFCDGAAANIAEVLDPIILIMLIAVGLNTSMIELSTVNCQHPMGRTPKITNDEIIQAAREVFLEQGEAASTAEIAQRAGISEASIFKRFATKQELFMAAIGIAKTPAWTARLESDIPPAAFKAELTEILGEMLIFYQDVLPRAVMMMSPMKLLHAKQFVPPPIRDSKLWADFFDRAIASGAIGSCNTQTLAHAIVGAINNYAMTQTLIAKFPDAAEPLKDSTLTPDEFIHSLVATLWSGMAPGS
jgi:AcrR family transcriptional regulator